MQSGTIYVLRSQQSADSCVAQHRDLIHKICVTGSAVRARIAHAEYEATYLLAPVEIVATYKLVNINRTRLEHLLHRIFAPARLDATIRDGFGNPVEPREWFLAPLATIDAAVAHIRDGSIADWVYSPQRARLVRVASVQAGS